MRRGAWSWCYPRCSSWCRRRSRSRRWCRCRTALRAVSAATIEIVAEKVAPAPDDHLAVDPDCRVTVSGVGRVSGAGKCPAVRDRNISSAAVKKAAGRTAAPDDHFAAGPHCRVKRRPSAMTPVNLFVARRVSNEDCPPFGIPRLRPSPNSNRL